MKRDKIPIMETGLILTTFKRIPADCRRSTNYFHVLSLREGKRKSWGASQEQIVLEPAFSVYMQGITTVSFGLRRFGLTK
jgi:hypothetical protein